MYGLRITAEPSSEPLTVAEAKLHLNLASAVTAHDAEIAAFITAARKVVEDSTGRSLISTQWELTRDSFPYSQLWMHIPRSPLQTIDEVTFLDIDLAEQTWDSTNYTVSTTREPGRLMLRYQKIWPYPIYQPDSVKVLFTAGYGDDGSDVPEPLKQAMKLLLSHYFEHRSAVDTMAMKYLPCGVEALCDLYRVGEEFAVYGDCE